MFYPDWQMQALVFALAGVVTGIFPNVVQRGERCGAGISIVVVMRSYEPVHLFYRPLKTFPFEFWAQARQTFARKTLILPERRHLDYGRDTLNK